MKDPSAKLILTLPIILQIVLFGYAATYNLDRVPYACLDNSKSKTSTEFLARLDGTGVFQRTQTLMNTSQIAGSIDSDKAMIVISIDSDFEKNLSQRKFSFDSGNHRRTQYHDIKCSFKLCK